MPDAQAVLPVERRTERRWLTLAIVVVYSLIGALAGAFAVTFVPTYIGGHIAPVSLLITVVANIVLPRVVLASGGGYAAVAPVVAFVLVTFVLASGRPEGDVLMPGGGAAGWVTYGVLFGGALVGFSTVVLTSRRT